MAESKYTNGELAELTGLFDEVSSWSAETRRTRFGRAEVSARTIATVAMERGLRIAATGQVWQYDSVLRALQRSGKVPPQKERGPRSSSPNQAVRPLAAAVASANRARNAEPGMDAIMGFFERDLGAFLRPEDRERAARTIDSENARKVQELTSELAVKTETRARLAMYLGVYDRVIARLSHRLDTLRTRGADPDDEERAEEAERAQEDTEARAVHAAEVTPIATGVVRRRR
jgi:hypothetical protein